MRARKEFLMLYEVSVDVSASLRFCRGLTVDLKEMKELRDCEDVSTCLFFSALFRTVLEFYGVEMPLEEFEGDPWYI